MAAIKPHNDVKAGLTIFLLILSLSLAKGCHGFSHHMCIQGREEGKK